MLPQKAENFKNLMFGWRITDDEKYEPNLFEKILSTPGSSKLINLVWNVFKLWQNGFILNQVSFEG